MKDHKLFTELETEFMAGERISVKNRQNYYNCLADVIKEGRGYFKNHETDQMECRELTEEEIEDMYFIIGSWLLSLN